MRLFHIIRAILNWASPPFFFFFFREGPEANGRKEGEAALQYVANLLLMTGHGSLVLLRLEDVGVEGHLRAPEACRALEVCGRLDFV